MEEILKFTIIQTYFEISLWWKYHFKKWFYIENKIYVQLNCYKIVKLIDKEKAANIVDSVVSNQTI